MLILNDENKRVKMLQEMNLRRAVICALILLPEEFTEDHLYQKIASLSYLGDVRMKVSAENPNKVANIVTPNLLAFREWYSSTLKSLIFSNHLRVIPNNDDPSSTTPHTDISLIKYQV